MPRGHGLFHADTVTNRCGRNTLSYDIRLTNLDLDGLQTDGPGNEGDDVTAIHLHDVTECVMPNCIPGDTAGTLHVLNIFGIPRGGDDNDDMVFDAVAGR